MSRELMRLGAVIALVCAGQSALAQESRFLVTISPVARTGGYQKVRVSAATLGARPVVVWHNTAIDPDCAPRTPGAMLSVLDQPAHGEVKIDDTPDYFAFPPANPRSACNRQKLPGHHAVYTAREGFVGRDRFVLQGTSGQGVVRRITVDVDVRPG